MAIRPSTSCAIRLRRARFNATGGFSPCSFQMGMFWWVYHQEGLLMRYKYVDLLAIAAVGLCVSIPSAHAECGVISGSGQAANPLNFDPPRRYDMVTLAKAHAVGAWKKEVRARCPGHSKSWTRARGNSITCEGYAGGMSCVATATPR